MEEATVLHLIQKQAHDLCLNFCGRAKTKPLHSFGPAVRPNYIIHYILEGKGVFCVGDTQFHLSAGQGFLIEQDVQTYYCADKEEPWTYVWAGFSGTKVSEYISRMGLSVGCPVFESGRREEIEMIVSDMMAHHTLSISDEFRLTGLLYMLLSVIASGTALLPGENGARENIYMRKAVEFVQTNYCDSIKVSDIANYVCINRSYLYTLFKKNISMSPQQFLSNFRITRASQMLLTTEFSIDMIAQSCGYQDPLVFSKAFKLQFRQTPTQYRKDRRKPE